MLGAAGGVGSFAVQVAVGLGAQVTASAVASDGDFVRTLGAAEVVLTSDRASNATELAAGSFDVAVDTVGGDLMAESLTYTRRGGAFVTLQQPPPARAARGEGHRRHLLRRPVDAGTA